MLAEAAAAMVKGGLAEHLDLVRVRWVYRNALRERGLVGGTAPGRLKHLETGKQYCAFTVPLTLVEQLSGLPTSEEVAAAEVGRLVYKQRSGIHPLRHLALICWLFPNFEAFLECYESAESPHRRGAC